MSFLASAQTRPIKAEQSGKITAEKANNTTEISGIQGKRNLIVYFSHTGNTKAFAEEIQQVVGRDLLALTPEATYPTDYNTVTRQAKQEIESGYTPKLKSSAVDTDAYDVVFVGTPIWWYTFAPPVRTFLTEYDLTGKTIVPFSTHQGSGLSGIGTKIAELQPNAKILEGFAVRHDQAAQERSRIAAWLKGLSL